jgi:hypothetical protein
VASDPHLDLNEPIIWPSTARSLLGEGEHWSLTACLGWSRGDWHMRIHGFRQAAELIGAYIAKHRHDQDGLIFPFLYNWRQHVELALKHLMVAAERLRDVSDKTPFGHNLEQLWTRCRASLEDLGGSSETELDNVGTVIAELHAMDPHGDAFRYPTGRDGSATLPGIDRLSFDRINDALVAVSNFLEAAETGVSVDLENKLDYEAEYAAEMASEYRNWY